MSQNLSHIKLLSIKRVVGVISFYDGIIDCSFNHKEQQYEITNFQGSYFLIKVSDSKEKSDFKCTVKEYKKYVPRLIFPSHLLKYNRVFKWQLRLITTLEIHLIQIQLQLIGH